MGSVNVYTAEHTDDVFDENIVDGDVVGNNLILTKRSGATVNAGVVVGPTGPAGTSAIVPERYVAATNYSVGAVVGFMGRLWKCIQAGSGKCPPFYAAYWKPLTGMDISAWCQDDPYFSASDNNSGYEMFWHTGTTTNSLTTTAGEFETGIQAYKCVLAASSSQRIYDRDESLLRGGEIITAKVRAKIVSTTGGTCTLNAILNATPKDTSPEPFAAGLTQTNAVEASQPLTTSFATYTFTMTAPNAVPRGRVHFTIDQGAGGTSTVVIDRIEIYRGKLGNEVYRAATMSADVTLGTTPIVPSFATLYSGAGITVDGSNRWVVPTKGLYKATASMTVRQSGGTGSVWHIVMIIHRRAGVAQTTRTVVGNTAANGLFDNIVADSLFDCLAGDTLEVQVQAQYASLSVADARSLFSVNRVANP